MCVADIAADDEERIEFLTQLRGEGRCLRSFCVSPGWIYSLLPNWNVVRVHSSDGTGLNAPISGLDVCLVSQSHSAEPVMVFARVCTLLCLPLVSCSFAGPKISFLLSETEMKALKG